MSLSSLAESLCAVSGRSPEESAGCSRRGFLQLAAAAVAGMSAWELVAAAPGFAGPLIITEPAEGLILVDPTRCVGCRRCEIACTEFNDGKSAPALARIKVRRNLNFGPLGLYTRQELLGDWGNGLIIADACRQCAHPVPCANACPNDAIVANPPLNARVVDPETCVGCRMCQRSCPWDMMAFDPETEKATKCHLCDGKPKCVEACPSNALRYVRWRDLTRAGAPRVAPTAVIPPEKAQACIDCHQK
jgi:Fe-S-cluster-containing dehydrogenase component